MSEYKDEFGANIKSPTDKMIDDAVEVILAVIERSLVGGGVGG